MQWGIKMQKEKVSIIVRTCGRPEVLRNALISIRNQTYSNIEVIIVEDGINASEDIVRKEFSDLVYKYACTERNVGRCKVGNIGLEMATGDFFNFLDDDDLLLPNHIKILVEEIKKGKYKAVYSIASEYQIKIISKKPFKFKVKRKIIRYKQPFNKLLLCYLNYIPIQSIMFSKELYLRLGGFDEQLNVLEDWDIWVRYSTICDFLFVPEVTSVYYTPYKSKMKKKREIDMQEATDYVKNKHQGYKLTMDAKYINEEMDYILNIYNKKKLLFYLQKIRNFLLYKDI